ncbi:MAG: MarR family transcriptional regulator [Candidatus Hydrogenedentes bacterium]|nr:MarR family transcriptional regulator [Candidatus Hydrogenedentota bacterium]
MTTDKEKLELARVVNKTQHLLHHAFLRGVFSVLDAHNLPVLTPAQVHMVMTVRQQREVTLKQLASALHVKAPAASAMVERLVEMGILTREENPTDRREVLVKVSAKDESHMQAMERRHLQFAMELIDKIGMKDARLWAGLCRRIGAALAQEENL